jgi:uncharacterized Zn finger protein
MAEVRLVSTRLTICPVCGDETRLIATTSDEVVSRCYRCGDVTRSAPEVARVWSASDAVRQHSLAGRAHHPEPRARTPA